MKNTQAGMAVKSSISNYKKTKFNQERIATIPQHNVIHSKQYLQNAGITLVALVVTIIAILILAGVTISLALGDNGIIGKAQYSSNMYANVTKNETTMMGEIEDSVVDLTDTSEIEKKYQKYQITMDMM